MKWPVEAIGVVAQVNPRLAAADRPDLDERVSFVPMAAVSGETLSIEAQAERLFSEVAQGYTPFKRGDVLVAKITPCFENGKMAMTDNIAHELGFGTTEFHVFRPSERITGSYLFNLLRAPYVRKAGAMRMKGAAGQRRVPADFFAALQIPLPPLDEQKRIAGILDAADALRAKRREALAQLDTLLQSTFLDMFGDPVTNPMAWEVQRLEDVFWLQEGPGVRNWQFKESGIKLLNVSNILTSGELDLSKTDRHLSTEEVQEKYSHFLVDAGDLVIASSGISIDEDDLLRTRSAFVRDEHLPLCMNTSTVRFKATDGVSDLRFLQQWLQSHEFRRQITREVTGSAQKNFGPTHLKRLRITLPPLDLLRRFDAIVESVEQQKARQRAHLGELDTLFACLQSRAFRGDL